MELVYILLSYAMIITLVQIIHVITKLDAFFLLLNCDDGNPCTNDTCDPQIGCLHPDLCNNIVCAVGSCNNGTCSYVDDGECAPNPDNPCTVGFCNTIKGMCDIGPKICDDGNGCTTDTCELLGNCGSVPNLSICSDGLVCTTDTCTPTSSNNTINCTHTFTESNCAPFPGSFPSDCGYFICNSTLSCGVGLNDSLCGPPDLPNCQISKCNAITGGALKGCTSVNNCTGLQCTCTGTAAFPQGQCLCTGGHKRNFDYLFTSGNNLPYISYIALMLCTLIHLINE